MNVFSHYNYHKYAHQMWTFNIVKEFPYAYEYLNNDLCESKWVSFRLNSSYDTWFIAIIAGSWLQPDIVSVIITIYSWVVEYDWTIAGNDLVTPESCLLLVKVL